MDTARKESLPSVLVENLRLRIATSDNRISFVRKSLLERVLPIKALLLNSSRSAS